MHGFKNEKVEIWKTFCYIFWNKLVFITTIGYLVM